MLLSTYRAKWSSIDKDGMALYMIGISNYGTGRGTNLTVLDLLAI